MPREHGDDGAFIETIRPADVRAVLDAVDGPVVLSADVADALDCTRETARRKLEQLHDRGDLARRKVSRRVIYWDPDDTTDAAGVSADGERYPTSSDESRERGVTATAESPASDALDDALRGWETDTQADSKVARAQTRRAATYLRDRPHERFTRRELQDALAADCELSDRGWWERAVRPGLMHLSDAALVEYRAGHHDYRWTDGSGGE